MNKVLFVSVVLMVSGAFAGELGVEEHNFSTDLTKVCATAQTSVNAQGEPTLVYTAVERTGVAGAVETVGYAVLCSGKKVVSVTSGVVVKGAKSVKNGAVYVVSVGVDAVKTFGHIVSSGLKDLGSRIANFFRNAEPVEEEDIYKY